MEDDDYDDEYYDDDNDFCDDPECEECSDLRARAEERAGKKAELPIISLSVEELQDISEKEMSLARKKHSWSSMLSGQGSTGGNNVLTGYVNNKGIRSTKAYPCHKPINAFKDALCLWSAFGYRSQEKIARFYHDWLLNDSPWSKTGIVPKGYSNDFMFQNGFIFTQLDQVSSNLLHNFLVATRMDAEWPDYISGWYKLVTEYGVDPSLAYMMVTVFVSPNQNSGGQSICTELKASVMTGTDKYDWPLDVSRATEEYVLNFCQGNPVGRSTVAFFPSAQTAPVNTLWGKLSVLDAKDTYLVKLKELYGSLAEIRDVQYLQWGVKKTVKIEGYSFSNIISIIKQEEIRLGLKENKVVSNSSEG